MGRDSLFLARGLFLSETSTHRMDLEHLRLRDIWLHFLWVGLILRYGIARILHPHGPVWPFPMDPLKRGLEPGKIRPKGIIARDFLEFTFWRNFRLFACTIRAECLFSLSRRLPKWP